MAGTRLEIFKFGMCLFFPIGVMYYTGLPSYFERNVKGQSLYPPKESMQDNKKILDACMEERHKRKTD